MNSYTVIDITKAKPLELYKYWMGRSADFKKKNEHLFPVIINALEKEPKLQCECWKSASRRLKEKNEHLLIKLFETIKEPELQYSLWLDADEKFRGRNENILLKLIHMFKENRGHLAAMWGRASTKTKMAQICNVIEIVKGSVVALKSIWNCSGQLVRVNNFFKVIEKLDGNEYEMFIKRYLGEDVVFSENGKLWLPDDLKRVIFNVSDEDLAYELEINFPAIIKNWNEIKEYIQRKKANNMINGGLEVRSTSISEILAAIKGLNRPLATSPSAREFERTKGSERMGVDVQFTANSTYAVQRAHEIAVKMDESSSIKYYPDFSVRSEENGVYLKVLHPQDKSGILLGHDTHCCFRPNGDADNHAKNKYSLLQYCATTPYGGLLRCESTDGNQVYMGTPFLVNGNCMMFHSYETANEQKVRECNELLDMAAKKAIEMSEGTLDIVFITTLHNGPNSLYIDDRAIIPPYFTPYTGEIYEKYKDMYENLDNFNCLLAARVGDRVLTGHELTEWYINECFQNPATLIKLLNLHMGKREVEFDFGRREIKDKIEIEEYQLIQAFSEKMSDLENRRNILALELQRRKLERIKHEKRKKNRGNIESKEELENRNNLENNGKSEMPEQLGDKTTSNEGNESLEISEQKELETITNKLKMEPNQEYVLEISKMHIDEIRAELQHNRDSQLSLYSGEDIDLIASIYGIDIEAELRKRIEESLKTIKNKKDRKKSVEGKVISTLMARVKECDDESVRKIVDLKQKIARNSISDEELNILEQAGIDVSQYRKTFLIKVTPNMKVVSMEEDIDNYERKEVKESKIEETGKESKIEGEKGKEDKIIGCTTGNNLKISNATIDNTETDGTTKVNNNLHNVENTVSNQEINEDKLEQRLRKGMKDKAQKEEIVADILFTDISESEIKNKATTILVLSVRNEIYKKLAYIMMQKGVEELTEEEINEINDEIEHQNFKTISEAVTTDTVTKEQDIQLDNIKQKYGVDIRKMYTEIMSDRNKIEKSVKSDRLAKLKAKITVGMDCQKKIETIVHRIEETDKRNGIPENGEVLQINGLTENESITQVDRLTENGENIQIDRITESNGMRKLQHKFFPKLVYGNSWYIALDENGLVQRASRSHELDANNFELQTYIETLKLQKFRLNSGQMFISKTALKKATSVIPAEAKKKLIQKMKRKQQNTKKNVPRAPHTPQLTK